MTKRLQSKHRISRRFGEDLWGREKNTVHNKNAKPGNIAKKPSRQTEYGVQLGDKQKLKFFYGNIGEKQFKNYYLKANKARGNTEEIMLGFLERRLDIVIFRARFSKTVFAARQFVSHKHVLVNGKCVNIASYLLSPGDIITFKEKSQKLIQESLDTEKRSYFSSNIEVDTQKYIIKYAVVPKIDEIVFPVKMNYKSVVEFYSR